MRRIQPFPPKFRKRARSESSKGLSGIIQVKRHGLRWQDAPSVYGTSKPLHDRFARWSRMGIFARISCMMAQPGVQGDSVMMKPVHHWSHLELSAALKFGH
ncbi:IS5 family transposase [Paracoccus sp. SM22M-07]|uniref:IS5 family transposase n=1 Tax=Paracoccus sp. SM22M-07 TaxID=1520813 RepID=UPI00090F3F77|nr:hypothetical protein IE00_17980 [Paracoccus sp. SM22M-07]